MFTLFSQNHFSQIIIIFLLIWKVAFIVITFLIWFMHFWALCSVTLPCVSCSFNFNIFFGPKKILESECRLQSIIKFLFLFLSLERFVLAPTFSIRYNSYFLIGIFLICLFLTLNFHFPHVWNILLSYVFYSQPTVRFWFVTQSVYLQILKCFLLCYLFCS